MVLITRRKHRRGTRRRNRRSFQSDKSPSIFCATYFAHWERPPSIITISRQLLLLVAPSSCINIVISNDFIRHQRYHRLQTFLNNDHFTAVIMKFLDYIHDTLNVHTHVHTLTRTHTDNQDIDW